MFQFLKRRKNSVVSRGSKDQQSVESDMDKSMISNTSRTFKTAKLGDLQTPTDMSMPAITPIASVENSFEEQNAS